MKARILGVYREKHYSNHAIDADKRVLDHLLHVIGDSTSCYIQTHDPDEAEIPKGFDIYLTMAQSQTSLSQLWDIEKTTKATVINNTTSIKNCFRENMSRLFRAYDIRSPQEWSVSSNDDIWMNQFNIHQGLWIKRGDYHSIDDDDVSYADNEDQFHEARIRLRKKGVDTFIVQKHIVGDIYKFYGVGDSFFTLRFMGSTTHDRNKLGPINTAFDINVEKLKSYAFHCAKIFGLNYYGGDFVITPSGDFYLIDLNDWPSFRTCYKEAAPHMAKVLLEKVKSLPKMEIECRSLEEYILNLITA